LGIKDDLTNAGAVFEDSPAVIDRHFVSSRKPDDLPAFMQAVLKVLEGQRQGKSENLKDLVASR
jgi:protease I